MHEFLQGFFMHKQQFLLDEILHNKKCIFII